MRDKYTKPVLTLDQQIDRIAKKGFIISDESRDIFKTFLLHHWYYHISSYVKCFCKTENWNDTTESKEVRDFDIINLYTQDRTLQYHLLNVLLRIEVFLKSTFIYAMTQIYQDPFCHINKNVSTHKNRKYRLELIDKIQEENKASPILINFFDHYDEEYATIWHLVEVASFGSFTKLFTLLPHKILDYFYENLKIWEWENISLGEKREILKNWLKWLATMRNRIAHSEMTRSIRALPTIKLPWIQQELNTTRSYIQLLIHFYECMFWEPNSLELKNFCYQILQNISIIPGLLENEKKRIWIFGNWQEWSKDKL